MCVVAKVVATLAIVASLAIVGSSANAQAVVKTIARDADVAYGLDALRLRILGVSIGIRTPRGPAGRDRLVESLPLPVPSRYAIVTLRVRNAGRIPENIPLFQTVLRLADGSVIDPAVYGPFIGDARTEAPTSVVIAPRRSVVLRIVVGDVPSDRAVESLVLSPNDATPAYRYRFGPNANVVPKASPAPER